MPNENEDKLDNMMNLVTKNTESSKPEKHLVFNPDSGDLVISENGGQNGIVVDQIYKDGFF